MARIVPELSDDVIPMFMWVKVLIAGLTAGLVYWLLSLLLQRFVVEPIVCHQVVNASLCLDAADVAGKIAAPLVAVGLIILFARFRHPLAGLTVVATTIVLWGLSGWLEGLVWIEALSWSVLLYAVTISLFGLVSRQPPLAYALIITTVVVVALRIAIML